MSKDIGGRGRSGEGATAQAGKPSLSRICHHPTFALLPCSFSTLSPTSDPSAMSGRDKSGETLVQHCVKENTKDIINDVDKLDAIDDAFIH